MAKRSARTRSDATRERDTDRIVQGLRRVVRALQLYSQQVYQIYGLTAPQLWALKTLYREGPLTAGRLARALCVHQSSLSLLLDRLEEGGLVRRTRPAHDRRFVHVELTDRGGVIAADAPEAAQGRLLHGLREMPARRVRAIREAVEAIVDAMEAENVEARFFFSNR